MTEKWAVVAGASGGIGSAICRLLVEDGWGVLAGYRSGAARAEELVEELRDAGHEADPLHLDLIDDGGVADALSDLSDRPVAGVVYAAGPPVAMQHLSTIEPRLYADQLLGDAAAFFNLVRPAIPLLRASRGALVAVTTAALARYSVKDILSVAPKAAVEATVRGVAAEEGGFGVRANCVAVGVIEAGIWDDLVSQGAYSQEFLEAARRNTVLRRFGTADDVAEAVRFLLSDRAGWVTGQTIQVDGGYAL